MKNVTAFLVVMLFFVCFAISLEASAEWRNHGLNWETPDTLNQCLQTREICREQYPGQPKGYVQYWYDVGDSICPTGETWNQDLQACEAPPVTPESCAEQWQLYDGGSGSCVAECPNGSLDGVCLSGAPVGEPNLDETGDTCDPGDPDYAGVFQGKTYCDGDLPEPAICPEGQMAWIVTDDSGSGAYVCGEAIKDPSEANEQESETTTSETVGDETTTITTDNQTGTTTTTVTNNVTGDSSTTINYPGVDAETGGPCTASSVSCLSTPETEKGICADGGSLCDDVNDIKKALEQTSDRTAKEGSFEVTEANTAVETAEAELSAGLDAIKSEISGYFDLSLTAGDMVCGPGVDVLGVTLQICPSTMKDQLAVIAQIVLLIAGVISLMIIFR